MTGRGGEMTGQAHFTPASELDSEVQTKFRF